MSCCEGRASSAPPRDRLGHRGILRGGVHRVGLTASWAAVQTSLGSRFRPLAALGPPRGAGAVWAHVGTAWAGPQGTSAQPTCASLAGQLAAGTCEIVTLDRDSSQPRRTIARQTARCACRKGQIAGTTRARPACVDGKSPGPPAPAPAVQDVLPRPPARWTGLLLTRRGPQQDCGSRALGCLWAWGLGHRGPHVARGRFLAGQVCCGWSSSRC